MKILNLKIIITIISAFFFFKWIIVFEFNNFVKNIVFLNYIILVFFCFAQLYNVRDPSNDAERIDLENAVNTISLT